MLNFKNIILDFIYPEKRRCLICGKKIFFPEIEDLCYDCLNDITYTSVFCTYCGRELKCDHSPGNDLNTKSSERCIFCSGADNDFTFNKVRSIFVYENLGREIIFNFKYFNKRELAVPLGKLLYIYFCKYYDKNEIDYIIPVPLYKKRKEERGYNQAGLLAEVLGQKSGIKVNSDSLIRVKKTPPLYDLNQEKRSVLVKNVFDMKTGYNQKRILYDKNILLVDDIFTTGVTSNEIAKTLKTKAGVNKVFVITLATSRVKAGNLDLN